MSNSQEKTENLLREREASRKPRIEKALARVQRKLENKENYIANAEARAIKKMAAYERTVASMKADLKLIAEGSYHGYNGLPFGFVSGLEGVDD